MIVRAARRIEFQMASWLGLGGAVLSLFTPSCATHGAKSGAAVGQLGQGLAMHSDTVPQGAEACAMKEALEPATGGVEKPVSETCGKAVNSDLLWRRATLVLSAYSKKLEALSSGASPETAGQLEGAMTGVREDNWIEAEPGEQAAKDAVTKLVNQLNATGEKADFDKTVKDAAPHVNTLCTGLTAYLGDQASKFAEIRADVEKKRAARTDRRCATFDNRTICVSHSFLDRMMYASTFGGLAMQEANHLEARADVASFCAAHAKLEVAAGAGTTNKDETYADIVSAVKAVPRAKPAAQPAAPEGAATETKPGETKPAETKPASPTDIK